VKYCSSLKIGLIMCIENLKVCYEIV